jgi:hypothetical protein
MSNPRNRPLPGESTRPGAGDHAGRKVFAGAPVPIWKHTHAQVEAMLSGGDDDLLRRDLRSLS